MKNLIYFILSGVVLISCTARQNEVAENSVTININTNQISNLSFNDLYELKQVIILETTQESLLSRIKKISFINDKVFVVTGAKLMECYEYMVFNMDGKFLYKQNKTGRGPGEYLKITTFQNNKDSIIVSNGNKLLYYNFNGDFMCETINNLASIYVDMCYVGDGTVLMNFARAEARDDKHYLLQLFSNKGEYIKGFLPIDKERMKMIFFAGYPVFVKSNNSIYFTPMTNNAIYEYNTKTLELREIYTVSVNGMPVFDINTMPSYSDTWYFENSHFWIGHIDKGNMLLLVDQVNGQKGLYYASINRETNEVALFTESEFRDVQNSLPINVHSSETGDLVSVVSYADLEKLTITDTNSIGYKLKQTLTENSNQAIVVYKRK